MRRSSEVQIVGCDALLPLTRGKTAILDAADAHIVAGQKWCFAGVYAVRGLVDARGVRTTVPLHRVLLNCPKGYVVDHIDGDPLNNRRCNLRICSQKENLRNQRKPTGKTTSKFKGVSARANGLWQVTIRVNREVIYIGHFKSEMEAANAYDQAAQKHHGAFARTNRDLGLLTR